MLGTAGGADVLPGEETAVR